MIGRRLTEAIVTGLMVTVCGCGIANPEPRSGRTPAGVPRDSAPATPAASVAPLRDSAPAVVARFALAYANVSIAASARRLRVLASLATPVYAARLRAGWKRSILLSARALLPGERIVARVTGVTLSARGRSASGVVTVSEALQLPGSQRRSPFVVEFMAEASQVGSAWRVASFEPRLGSAFG
jgi:hypothetical protein